MPTLVIASAAPAVAASPACPGPVIRQLSEVGASLLTTDYPHLEGYIYGDVMGVTAASADPIDWSRPIFYSFVIKNENTGMPMTLRTIQENITGAGQQQPAAQYRQPDGSYRQVDADVQAQAAAYHAINNYVTFFADADAAKAGDQLVFTAWFTYQDVCGVEASNTQSLTTGVPSSSS